MMDSDFVKVFAMSLAAILGLPSLFLVGRTCVGVGKKWGGFESAQASAEAAHTATAKVVAETRDAVRNLADAVNPRLAKIEFILCGPDGENGLRSDMRDLRERVVAIERRTGPPDRRKNPRPQSDRRKGAE